MKMYFDIVLKFFQVINNGKLQNIRLKIFRENIGRKCIINNNKTHWGAKQ